MKHSLALKRFLVVAAVLGFTFRQFLLVIQHDDETLLVSSKSDDHDDGASAQRNITGQDDDPILGQDTALLLQTLVEYKYPRVRLLQTAATTAAATTTSADNNTTNTTTTSILIGVLSVAKNVDARNAIRDTWGRNQALLFVMAGNWTAELEQEALFHQDVLWLDRPETYDGLPYKTFCFLEVARKHTIASSFDYVYKTDDDVYLNMDKLHQLLIHDFARPDYFGHILHMGIIRNPTRKWAVTEQEYPNATHFHPFNIGAGYAISSKILKDNPCVAQEMVQQSFLPLEDVSIGWVMHKCQIQRVEHFGWEYWDNPWLFEYVPPWSTYQSHFFHSGRSNLTVVNLYEIKHAEVMRRLHVEYCLDQYQHTTKNQQQSRPSSSSSSWNTNNCLGVNISCALNDPKRRSGACQFVDCGGGTRATNCESCPRKGGSKNNHGPEAFKRMMETCGGDCKWCSYGTNRDGHYETLRSTSNKLWEFKKQPTRCVPRRDPQCRTEKEAKQIIAKSK
jgi:hypothetical protein